MPQILQDLTFILVVAVLFTAPLYWINRPKRAAKAVAEQTAVLTSPAPGQAD